MVSGDSPGAHPASSNWMWLVMGSGGRENSEVRGSQKTPAVEAGSVEKLPVEGSLLNEKAS
ncbi:unnamed protein product [Nezara viridula]|uniref:Uncharacterized protein n=1 Tax=Nezara viridula TaxID=85310 RepID=A0A9P0MQ36_NEZVI|nr:unnamed protein product [Nezara viridula]